MLSCRSSQLVYRNPKPHLRSRQTYHPTLLRRPDGEMLCSFDLCEAVESLDYRTWLSRSSDDGLTWQLQGQIPVDEPHCPMPVSLRLRQMSDGTVVAFGGRWHRDDPDEGQVNRETQGMAPMDLILLRSADGGRHWGKPEILAPPVVGPCFEICHPIVELPGGRWLAPTSTWRGWSGEHPSGEMAITLISDDRGKSWPRFGVSFDGRKTGYIHWEQSVAPLRDGRLLAVAWAYDPRTGRTLPTPYCFSADRGETFSAPRPTGFRGQTCKLLPLADGRLLCVYRRDDKPGLWGTLAHLEGDAWINEESALLWGNGLSNSGMAGASGVADGLSDLKFGYPSLLQLPSGEVMVAFWCFENWSTNIRLLRLDIR